jgi:hypothetical protein
MPSDMAFQNLPLVAVSPNLMEVPRVLPCESSPSEDDAVSHSHIQRTPDTSTMSGMTFQIISLS